MSANTTPDATATPRTDAEATYAGQTRYMDKSVSADFARTLERELIACQNEIRGILDECAKHITLSNDFPWSEEVYCAFRAIRREIADTKKQANDEFDAIITRNMELEKQLTAAKAEIEIYKARETCAVCGTSWDPSLIEAGECIFCTLRKAHADNAQLRAEVERLNGVKNQLERTGFQTVTQLADAWLNHQNTFKSQTAYVAEVEARETQLRARVADLENDLEKSKHDADDWHRAWETVTEQAMKEVAELEQALAASATKAAAEYGEQLKPLFAKVRELEAAVAWAEQQLLGDSGTGETYWETVPGYAAFKRAARAGRGAP